MDVRGRQFARCIAGIGWGSLADALFGQHLFRLRRESPLLVPFDFQSLARDVHRTVLRFSVPLAFDERLADLPAQGLEASVPGPLFALSPLDARRQAREFPDRA